MRMFIRFDRFGGYSFDLNRYRLSLHQINGVVYLLYSEIMKGELFNRGHICLKYDGKNIYHANVITHNARCLPDNDEIEDMPFEQIESILVREGY